MTFQLTRYNLRLTIERTEVGRQKAEGRGQKAEVNLRN